MIYRIVLQTTMTVILLAASCLGQDHVLVGIPDFASHPTRTTLEITDPAVIEAIATEIAACTAYLDYQQIQLQTVNAGLATSNERIVSLRTYIADLEAQLVAIKQSLDALREQLLVADYFQFFLICEALLEKAMQFNEAQAELDQSQAALAVELAYVADFEARRPLIIAEIDITIAELLQLNIDLEVAQHGAAPIEPDDVIYLAANTNSTISSPLTVKTIGVDGTLTISGELRIQNLLVYPDGTLILEPGARIVIRDLPFDLSHDPEQWSNGIIIHGKIRSSVASKSHYARFADIYVGDSSLTGVEPLPDWVVGDELILPRTRPNNPDRADQLLSGERKKWMRFYAESERVKISGIEGSTIHLENPARFEHTGAVDRNGEQVTWVPVANITRDILIESENPNGVRGHFACVHHADVYLQGVTFRNLGRTTIDTLNNGTIDSHNGNTFGMNQIGRYPIHLHHLVGPENGVDGGAYQAVIDNCVVDGGDLLNRQKWAIALHRASWCLIKDNVCYNFAGGGIVEEDGCERSNVYDGNYVCRSVSRTLFRDLTGAYLSPEREGKDPTNDTDIRGTGACAFWFARSYDIRCTNNICCDIQRGTNSNWNPDGAGSVYWISEALHFAKMPTERGQDQTDWSAFTNQSPVILPHWAIDGGETFGGSANMHTISGLEEFGSNCTVSNHVIWHMATGLNDYWVQLNARDCQVFGSPDLMLNSGEGIITQRETNSTYDNIRVDNMGVGLAMRIGRGSQRAEVNGLDSACPRDIEIAQLGKGGGGYEAWIRSPRFATSAVAYRGWVGAVKPPAKVSNLAWGPLDKDFIVFSENIVHTEDWNSKNYRIYPLYQAADFVIPDTAKTQQLGVALLTNQEAWDTKGLAIYGSVMPATAVEVEGMTGAKFDEEMTP